MIRRIEHTGYLHPQLKLFQNDLRLLRSIIVINSSYKTNLGRDTNFSKLLIDTTPTMGYNSSHE